MLHLIIADAELETVPKEISHERVIRWHARRKGRRETEILLDSNYHYPAMRRLADSERRGRPDIVHICLLLALDSPLNRAGLLRIYLHTRNNKLITVYPEVRIPRSFNRFVGLMEQLFLTGSAPHEKPLLKLSDASLKDIVSKINPTKVITLSEKGEKKFFEDIFSGLSIADDVCVIAGGFPHGDFLSDVRGVSDEILCIDPEPLDAPTVVSRIIFSYEDSFGIQRARFSGDRSAPPQSQNKL
jgi:rRNA small subunit pseudouridine methyltransferase Nep1